MAFFWLILVKKRRFSARSTMEIKKVTTKLKKFGDYEKVRIFASLNCYST